MPAAPPATPSGLVRLLSTPAEATALAAHLLDPDRDRPVAVVSVPGGRETPWIDAEHIARETEGLCDVHLVHTGPATEQLAADLPDKTQVYGGTARVYPVGTAWTTNPYLAPLRFAYGDDDGARSTELLVGDALRMAHGARKARSAGSAQATTAPTTTARPASGTVRQVVEPSRALVALDDGGIATVWTDLTAPGVDVSHLLTPGMRVTGVLDGSGRLDISGMADDAPEVTYASGDVVLARVTEVAADVVHLALRPDVVVAVPREHVTGNEHDALTSLFSVGEVVVARVAEAADGVALRLDDVDDDEEPLPAPAVLPGGPPWLEPPSYDLPDDAPVPEPGPPALPQPVPAQSAPADLTPDAVPVEAVAEARTPGADRPVAAMLADSLDSARTEVERLRQQVARLEGTTRELEELRQHAAWLNEERARLVTLVERQRTQLRRRTTGARAARKDVTPAELEVGHWFADPEEQLRFEVQLAWARRIRPEEKADRPLRPYRISPGFLPSLERLQGVRREKVVDVVVEVLTGLAETLPGRAVHPLRESAGGSAAQVRRDGGWVAWRVNLQTNAPSARRLHYWSRGDEVELWEVSAHDDLPL